MIVNIYKNVKDTKGVTANLFDILTTDRWRHLSDKVRAEKDTAKRDKLKLQLPAFTPSGTFKTRNKKGLIKHSGYMCIDIDADDNPGISDWQAVVFELGKLPQVAFAGLSVSGNGVFALIPILHRDRHEDHFRALEISFKKRNIIIDPNCSDVSRLRFYSYNKEYYINRDAEPYTHLYKEPPIIKSKPIKRSSTASYYSNENNVDALVREIVASGINIVPDYDSWFKVGAALSNVSNGRELFHSISRIDSSKYNYKECDKKFDNIKPGGGITINTLFYIAENHGIALERNDNSSSFVDLNTPQKANKQPVELPTSIDTTQVCFVDKEGKVYIPTPCSDSTFSVHASIEQYNSRKGLPEIIDKDQVDTSQMSKRYINLSTLSIS